MLIYLIVCIISYTLLYVSEINCIDKKISKAFVLLSVIIPSLLAGLRSYSVGGDTSGYGLYWFYESLNFDNWLEFLSYAKSHSIDYGYATLNYIFSRFSEEPHWFFFALCFLELTLLYFSVKPFCKNHGISLAFLIYFLLYYNDSLNNLRQFPAILIVLFSYRFIKDKKLVPFLLCVLLASTFHISALFAMSLYVVSLLAEKKDNKTYLMFISICILFFCINFNSLFSYLVQLGFNLSRYEHYIEEVNTGGKYIRLFFFGIIWLYFVLNFSKYRNSTVNIIKANTLLYYATISLMFTSIMFIGITNFAIRLSYYFDFFLLIYIPGITRSMNFAKDNPRLYKISAKLISVIIVSIVYWVITYAIRNGASTIPYKFYWE